MGEKEPFEVCEEKWFLNTQNWNLQLPNTNTYMDTFK